MSEDVILAGVLTLCLVLVVAVIAAAVKGAETMDPNRCRVDEEWCGAFIGRRWCSTHEVRWDGGGSCPDAGLPPRVGKP